MQIRSKVFVQSC